MVGNAIVFRTRCLANGAFLCDCTVSKRGLLVCGNTSYQYCTRRANHLSTYRILALLNGNISWSNDHRYAICLYCFNICGCDMVDCKQSANSSNPFEQKVVRPQPKVLAYMAPGYMGISCYLESGVKYFGRFFGLVSCPSSRKVWINS